MWKLLNKDLTNIKCSIWYNTCLMVNGNPTVVQEMKFDRGLWWTRSGTYTYYSPTHFWEN